jgi:molecular chaperone DnaK (HSP70)
MLYKDISEQGLPYKLFRKGRHDDSEDEYDDGEEEPISEPIFITDSEEYVRPEEISALVLRRCKQLAQQKLRTEVDTAVIAVPAYYTDLQCQATRDAAAIAGLNVLRLVDGPSAAAIGYSYQCEDIEPGYYLVADLGGGTFDMSILLIERGQNEEGHTYVVVATAGDNRLGGEDFTNALVSHVTPHFPADVSKIALKKACETAKKEMLSSGQSADISVNGDEVEVTPSEFLKLAESIFDRIKKVARDVLQKLHSERLKSVILVGGASFTYGFKSAIAEVVGDVKFADVPNNTTLVALGATHVGQNRCTLTDVVTRNTGIAVKDGSMTCILERNQPLPIEGSEMFTTTKDNQTEVHFGLYQGENERFRDNIYVCNLTITGLRPAPAGAVDIEATIQMTEEGDMKLSAVAEGAEGSLQVHRRKKFTEGEIAQMKATASKRFPIEPVLVPGAAKRTLDDITEERTEERPEERPAKRTR